MNTALTGPIKNLFYPLTILMTPLHLFAMLIHNTNSFCCLPTPYRDVTAREQNVTPFCLRSVKGAIEAGQLAVSMTLLKVA